MKTKRGQTSPTMGFHEVHHKYIKKQHNKNGIHQNKKYI